LLRRAFYIVSNEVDEVISVIYPSSYVELRLLQFIHRTKVKMTQQDYCFLLCVAPAPQRAVEIFPKNYLLSINNFTVSI
jgi:hypothetical protein